MRRNEIKYLLLQKILLFLKFSFFAFCFKYLGSAFINMKFILIEAFPSYFAFFILPFCYWFATELFQSQLWNLVAGTVALSLFSGCLAVWLAGWLAEWLTDLLFYLLTYIHTPKYIGHSWDSPSQTWFLLRCLRLSTNKVLLLNLIIWKIKHSDLEF